MAPSKICPEFSPRDDHAALCTCNIHWNHHSMIARKAFWDNAEKHMIDKVISACKKDNEHPCPGYYPSSPWKRAKGEEAPKCICSRPMRSHPIGEVLKGIRRYDSDHPTSVLPVCGRHIGSLTLPGTCSVCNHKWIEHAPANRGLVIESYQDIHKPSCKSVLAVGDIECSCMTDKEIQQELDRIGGLTPNYSKKEEKMPCKSYRSKSTGHTHCGNCGEPFYSHSMSATGGFKDWLLWRAANLTNQELLRWFMTLPGVADNGRDLIETGATRKERTRYLEQLLTNPTIKYTPPPNMVVPNGITMLALLEALDGGAFHRVKRTNPEGDLSPELGDVVEATVITEADLQEIEKPKLFTCFGCGKETAPNLVDPCDECEAVYAAMGTPSGPALRAHDFKDTKRLGGS